jgi:O-acetyl-ADP-ribose deacetylase (regulator of RNase III)
MSRLTYVTGDLLRVRPCEHGWHVVAHVVNNVPAFGAGLAAQMARVWPDTKKQYYEWSKSSTFQLGRVEMQMLSSGLVVAHLLAQNGLPAHDNPRPLDYEKLAQCLKTLGVRLQELEQSSLHIPRLGCGLARGLWPVVATLLEQNIPAAIPITVYTKNE